jgi:hypothetical protein
MAENKGRGVKGRGYDELSGVGTSSAGITGTTGNLNTARHDGGVGEPPLGDAGNRQKADHGQSGDLPALGRHLSRTGAQNRQSAQERSAEGGATSQKQKIEDQQKSSKSKQKGPSQ